MPHFARSSQSAVSSNHNAVGIDQNRLVETELTNRRSKVAHLRRYACVVFA